MQFSKDSFDAIAFKIAHIINENPKHNHTRTNVDFVFGQDILQRSLFFFYKKKIEKKKKRKRSHTQVCPLQCKQKEII